MFEHFNLLLFSALNAQAGLAGWQLMGALFAAQWLVFLMPLALIVLWTGGARPEREVALRALVAAVCALSLNGLIGQFWYSPRPFLLDVGHTFLLHDPDSSFPSDHATSMFSVALVLAFCHVRAARRIGLVLLPLALVVAWSRVFLGVHWPKDMAGALAMSAAMALLAYTPAVRAACAGVMPWMENLYRRVLAVPIGRGWLRP